MHIFTNPPGRPSWPPPERPGVGDWELAGGLLLKVSIFFTIGDKITEADHQCPEEIETLGQLYGGVPEDIRFQIPIYVTQIPGCTS